MQLFNDDDHGKLISERLSEILRKWTSVNDRAKVAQQFNAVGTSTIRDVILRYNNLSPKNAPAIEMLALKALENMKQNRESAEKDIEFLALEMEVK